ncbi:hypothetical protein [Clostridium brassicae]|uniref:DUF5082 domain-containing protein n=1 Tax=Clostridium brassicae TaxID=2999072 RepID=A0ABT4D6U1_9CLOT|nr:hypothetical protein [Clostridium brassicae]MCY6958016.1 hypothetical protein [Clostridium brassicae]
MSKNKERIREKIYECRKEIEKYTEYKAYMLNAEDYCKQAGNGISLLMNDQYEKVKSNCIEAIGEEDDLLSALQVKNTNLHEVQKMILNEIQKGINGINKKLEELERDLKSLLESYREE